MKLDTSSERGPQLSSPNQTRDFLTYPDPNPPPNYFPYPLSSGRVPRIPKLTGIFVIPTHPLPLSLLSVTGFIHLIVCKNKIKFIKYLIFFKKKFIFPSLQSKFFLLALTFSHIII